MHTRQIGAAHINIFYFLIILVLFFGALFFGYVQLQENGRLSSENATLQSEKAIWGKDKLLLEHYSEDIGAALQVPGSYEGRSTRRGDYRIEGSGGEVVYEAGPLENVAGIAAIQDQIRQFSTRVGVPEAQGLPDFLARIGNLFDAQAQRIADANSQLQQLQQEKSAADASFQNATRAGADRERQITSDMTAMRTDLEAQLANKDSLILSQQDSIQGLREQLSTEQEQRDAQIRQLRDTMNRVQAQNDAMKQKYSLINPPQAPDGTVLTAHPRLNVAIIDLGRKDMLQRGTRFQISDPDRPGQVKAIGTVTVVNDEQSEITISDVADPFRPVTRGDLISNELYSPEIRRNIYLMGRFGYPFTKEGVKALLERLGNTVVDQIKPGVDLVIVGNELIDEESGTMIPLEETPEYRQVMDLSIEVAPLNRVRDLLKFDER